DLLQAAEVLEWKRPRVSAADRQSRPFAIGALAALEHDPVRGHAALGAARHDKTDLLGLLHREIALKQKLQRERCKPAAQILAGASPPGLANDPHDGSWIEAARLDSCFNTRHIVRRGRRDALDLGSGHACQLPTLGTERSAFGGRKDRLNTSPTVGLRGSSNAVTIASMEFAMRTSLMSPTPSSPASGVAIRVLVT